MPAGNFIAPEQISDEPPFQRGRGKQRAIQIEERADLF
jgi:hypothetical protein